MYRTHQRGVHLPRLLQGLSGELVLERWRSGSERMSAFTQTCHKRRVCFRSKADLEGAAVHVLALSQRPLHLFDGFRDERHVVKGLACDRVGYRSRVLRT